MFAPDLTFWLTLALLIFVVGQRGGGFTSVWFGRLALLLLLSPGLRYLSAIFTFELRLWLSAVAGSLLRLAGLAVTVEGNVLTRPFVARPGLSGEPIEMAVDPACMGLQLTGVSLLVAVFGLIWFERQRGRQVSLAGVLAFGAVTFGLTLLCNLFRIMLLVAFTILPDDPLHEFIGLICVLVYGWLPALGIAWWLVSKSESVTVRRIGERTGGGIGIGRWAGYGLVGLVLVACWAMTRSKQATYPNHSFTTSLSDVSDRHALKNYRCRVLPSGFVQYDRPGVLIYHKILSDWWSAEHSPTVCWRGSGYDLRHIRQTTLNGHPAYVGELQKGPARLYTAWWFSNGRYRSIGQWDIRSRMIAGEPAFTLVNVTTDDPARLATVCADWP